MTCLIFVVVTLGFEKAADRKRQAGGCEARPDREADQRPSGWKRRQPPLDPARSSIQTGDIRPQLREVGCFRHLPQLARNLGYPWLKPDQNGFHALGPRLNILHALLQGRLTDEAAAR